MEWAKYLAVVLTAMAPWGEELIAIPLGIGLGLSTPVVAVIALFSNYIPALIISILFKFGQNSPLLFRWLGKLRRERVKRILDRYGLIGVILVTPWLGVYATVTTLEILEMNRKRLQLAVITSLILYAVIMTCTAHYGIGLLKSMK